MTSTTIDSPLVAHSLRLDAQYAYLDGRTRRAKQLNKLADEMDARLRERPGPTADELARRHNNRR